MADIFTRVPQLLGQPLAMAMLCSLFCDGGHYGDALAIRETAIATAVRPGMLVLEVGSGSGQLAMNAARAGDQVVPCEQNPIIAEAAQRFVALNELADQIQIVARRSDTMTLSDDLPPFGPAEQTGSLQFTGGVVEGIAQWIKIRFPKVRALENDPFMDGPNPSWAATNIMLPVPIETLPGDVIEVTFRLRGKSVSLEVAPQQNPPNHA